MEGNTAITAITGALSGFTPAALTDVLTAGLGIAVPLVLAWFAYRFIYRKAKGAITRGK